MRPIIRPETKDRQNDEDQHPVHSGAHAAEDDLAELDVETPSPGRTSGIRLSCIALTAPHEAVGRHGSEEGEDSPGAEANLLALHVAA